MARAFAMTRRKPRPGQDRVAGSTAAVLEPAACARIGGVVRFSPAVSWLARNGWLGAFCMATLVACDSVVPPDLDFAASRCQTVYDDGVAGMPTFELGAILEITTPEGKIEENGTYVTRAMRLAIQDLNDHRDIAGKRFRLRLCDTRADWSTGGGQVTRDLATWLVEKGKVQAILTDASSDTQTVQAVTVPKGVLVMAISATSQELTNVQDQGLVWRVAPSDIYQGAVLAQMVSSTVAESAKVVVLATRSPYGDGLVDSMGDILGERLIEHTFDSDGKGLAAAVQATALDGTPAAPLGAIVIVAGSAHGAKITNARAKFPSLANVPLIFSDGACDGTLANQVLDPGVSLAGARCAVPGQPATDVYKQFKGHYQQKFAVTDLDQRGYVAHAFDAVYCVALAHAWAVGADGKGKVDGAALAEGLRHLSKDEAQPLESGNILKIVSSLRKGKDVDIEGASGLLDFNPETGEAPSAYATWTLGPKGELKTQAFVSVSDLGGGKYLVAPIVLKP